MGSEMCIRDSSKKNKIDFRVLALIFLTFGFWFSIQVSEKGKAERVAKKTTDSWPNGSKKSHRYDYAGHRGDWGELGRNS